MPKTLHQQCAGAQQCPAGVQKGACAASPAALTQPQNCTRIDLFCSIDPVQLEHKWSQQHKSMCPALIMWEQFEAWPLPRTHTHRFDHTVFVLPTAAFQTGRQAGVAAGCSDQKHVMAKLGMPAHDCMHPAIA
jgi:hypothetical protein